MVVPEELRFPHACCVGIASQTSLSLFNPSERWQHVSITVTSLAIDGEKVRRIQHSDRPTNPLSKHVRRRLLIGLLTENYSVSSVSLQEFLHYMKEEIFKVNLKS